LTRTASLLLLLAGCGDSTSGTSALTDLCRTNCAKAKECMLPDDPQCQASCETSYANLGYNDTVLGGLKGCIQTTPCGGNSSMCTDSVFANLPQRPVDDAYNRACLTRQSDCPAMSVTCGKDTRPFTESFVKDRLQPCLSVPCDQIKSCEGALFR
jgi:hypothetical protein